MAGSYNHAVLHDVGGTQEGKLRARGESMMIATENAGDSYETIEEMYGMIWWLASQIRGDLALVVEDARVNYKRGLGISPGIETYAEHDQYMRATYPEEYTR